MQIGQISELSGYSQRMIRYLEDQGLITPARLESNLRRFEDKDLTRILKIKRLKELGFSYAEIKSLIDKDDQAFAEKGSDVLKRHHADAHDLIERIRQLELLCYGEVRTKAIPAQNSTYRHPLRTAYRIQKLETICNDINALYPDLKIDVSLWKFGELRNAADFQKASQVQVFETFRASSIMTVLTGESFTPIFCSIFEKHSLALDAQSIGHFSIQDMSEFFASSEIVINFQILDSNSEKVFHAILPYQAIFIASGEATKDLEP